ncbi:MAG: hypothetical protein AB1664_13740 [Thermodesulfobacteriota bacterium]
MSTLTVVYVLLLIAGIGWVVYRISLYMRTEREREARWTKMFTDDQFKKYLAKMGSHNPTAAETKSARKEEGETARPKTDPPPQDR